MRFSGHTFPERFDVDDDAEHDKFATTWPCLRRDIMELLTCIKLAPRKKRMATNVDPKTEKFPPYVFPRILYCPPFL